MSWLSQGVHALAGDNRPGLLSDGSSAPPGGNWGLLGEVVHAPIDILRGALANIRSRPQILALAIEDARMRQRALQNANNDPAWGGGQAPQQPVPSILSQGGDGQTVDPTQPLDPGTVALPASVEQARGRPDYRALVGNLARLAIAGNHGAGAAMTGLAAAQPDIATENGVAYDRHDGSMAGQRVGVDLANVNGFQVDQQNPDNANRYVPQPPVTGAVPLYGPDGRNGDPVAWQMPGGAVQAISQAAGAEQAGRQANTIVTGHDSQGRDVSGYAGRLYGDAPGQGGNGGGVLTGQSPSDLTYGQHTAEAAATRFNGYVNPAQTAPARIAQLQQLGQLLDGFNGNRLSPTGIELARFAASMGLPINPHTGNQEAATAIANQMALQLRDPSQGGGMPGAMSDADRNFLVQSIPGLTQTDQGRRALINNQVAVAQRQVEVAHFAQQWQGRYGRIDTPDAHGHSFEDQLNRWVNMHPLFAPAHH